MPSSIEKLQYHIVWSTKYRYSLLTNEMSKTLKQYFIKKQEKWGFQIKSIAIEDNHIHLLVQLKSSREDLNNLIQKLKGGSSFLLRKKFRFLSSYPSLWTASHFVASVGNVSDKTIEEYLNKQGIEEKEIVQRTFKYKILSLNGHKKKLLKQYFKACLKKDKTKAPSGILQDFKRIKRKENEFGLYLRSQLLKIEKRDTKDAKYWLQIPGSRYEKSFWIGLQGRDLPKDYKIADSTIRGKNKEYFIYLSIKQERIIKRANANKVIAIDLGVNHPIAYGQLEKDKLKEYGFQGKEIKN